MKPSRLVRFVAALIALFSMLFMQLAVAAYACPELKTWQSAPSMEMSADAADQGMTACQDMDMAQPSLCHAHEQTGNQSLDKPGAPQVAQFVPTALVATLLTIDTIGHRPSVQPESLPLERSTAPPLSIRNCCFRI